MQLQIISDTNQDRQLVSGRDLHEFLEVKTRYIDWFNRMDGYDFEENEDYILVTQKRETNNPKNPTTEAINHNMTLDMAKEVAMLQRTEKGKQARKYFIQVEKDWNNPEKIMLRALQIATKRVECYKKEIELKDFTISELKPKAEYVDTILTSKSLVTVNQIASDYGLSSQKLNAILKEERVQYKQSGQWLMYSKLRDKGYTQSQTIDVSKKADCPKLVLTTKWTQKGRLFIHGLLKDRGIVATIEQNRQTA